MAGVAPGVLLICSTGHWCQNEGATLISHLLLGQIRGKLLPLPELQYKEAGNQEVVVDVPKRAAWNLKGDVHFSEPGVLESYGVAVFGRAGEWAYEVRCNMDNIGYQ
jgi:hypothetical protein